MFYSVSFSMLFSFNIVTRLLHIVIRRHTTRPSKFIIIWASNYSRWMFSFSLHPKYGLKEFSGSEFLFLLKRFKSLPIRLNWLSIFDDMIESNIEWNCRVRVSARFDRFLSLTFIIIDGYSILVASQIYFSWKVNKFHMYSFRILYFQTNVVHFKYCKTPSSYRI